MPVDPNEDCEKIREDEQGFPEYRYCDPATPLSEEFLKANFVSGVVMPSSEAHFFDYSQHHENILGANGPSGINFPFPSPSSVSAVADSPYSPEWWAVSGLYKTFGADVDTTLNAEQTGIFHFDGSVGQFSNRGTKYVAIDFNLFQPFIHHGHDSQPPVYFVVPYVSDYVIATPYYPYPY